MDIQVDLRPYRNEPPAWDLVLEVKGASPERIQLGLDAAKHFLEESKVPAYTGYMAYDTLTEKWGSVIAAPKEFQDELMYAYQPVCVWGDIWLDAMELALKTACSNLPNGDYPFLFAVTSQGNLLGARKSPREMYSKDSDARQQQRYSDLYELWVVER